MVLHRSCGTHLDSAPGWLWDEQRWGTELYLYDMGFREVRTFIKECDNDLQPANNRLSDKGVRSATQSMFLN